MTGFRAPPTVEASTARRPFIHSLAGARLSGMLRTIAAHGGISPRHAAQLGFMIGGGILRWPMYSVESLRLASRVKRVTFEPPVFIVGHWRSGTTYLHNLMSGDPGFAFPTITDALRPYEFFPSPLDFISRSLLLHSLPATRPMDDVPVREGWPQEEELALASMGAPSFYNCLYFPRRMAEIFVREVLFDRAEREIAQRWQEALLAYLGKLAVLHPGRRLLLKNPANSARIQHLRRLFPRAKFIHIHRDPLDVYRSTCKLYRRMLPFVALQGYDPACIDDHVLWSYPRLMDALFSGLATLPSEDRVDVAYAELVRDPAATLEQIYRTLNLGDFAPLRSRFATCIQTFASEPRPERRADDQPARAIGAALHPYRVRLGYESQSVDGLERVA